MTILEEKNNIIEAIKNCNIGKLEKYIDKNGLTLNMWGVMFYVPLIETIQILLKNNASMEFVKNTINTIKSKRIYITELIQKGNIKDMKEYIEANAISQKEIQNEDFDILVICIENNASNEIINYIINHFQYKSFNYYNNQKNLVLDKGDTPLFFAIKINNFQLADLLLNNGADINYDNGKILCHLVEEQSLNKSNLKFVLRHGYKIEYIDRFVISLIQHHVNEDKLLPDSLDAMSTEQLENIIEREQRKVFIKDEWYKEAVSLEHYHEIDAYSDLIERDGRPKDFVLQLVEEYHEEIYNSYKIKLDFT
ncbi:hypothetical protein PIROE2DRAFT_10771 [Piromyces sp. E2]|nr:hypothetical protein PIROE2DRAFT_10771 [Piromyces sp. E2]|eukprot:OUM62847.1 hypothetical protein PIROE2DRAFT_10771 [Piromyces sp. E2]